MAACFFSFGVRSAVSFASFFESERRSERGFRLEEDRRACWSDWTCSKAEEIELELGPAFLLVVGDDFAIFAST